MSVEQEYLACVEAVRTQPAKSTVTNDEKLVFYGLYKQINEGDCTDSEPWAVQLEKKAKWTAWMSRKGMAKEECMAAYVAEFNRQKEVHG